MPGFINKNNVDHIIYAGKNPDEVNFIQYDRIKTITDENGDKITQCHQKAKESDPDEPIIETIKLPACESKYVLFDNTVTGDYFVNTPFVEMTGDQKLSKDVEIQDEIDRQPKEAIVIMKDIFASFEGADLTRIMYCINQKGSFKIALEALNYVLAKDIIDEARAENLLIDSDVVTLKGLLPKTD